MVNRNLNDIREFFSDRQIFDDLLAQEPGEEAEDALFGFSENDDLSLMPPDQMALIDDFATLDETKQKTVMDMVQLLLKQTQSG